MSKPKNLQRQKEMFKLVEQWQNSTQNKKQFCRDHSININTFIYWTQKYKKNMSENNNSNFVELKISEDKPKISDDQIKLIYPNGVQAEIPTNTNIGLIRSLINL